MAKHKHDSLSDSCKKCHVRFTRVFIIILPLDFIVLGTAFAQAGVAQNITSSTSANTAQCEQACAQLGSAFGSSRLHYPVGDNFTIWDAKQQEVRPACRDEPNNATEVSTILKIVTNNWCRFAVKGGGHSRNADDANSVGGVTIDLGRINSVEVAADLQSARVGEGADSALIYQQLEPQNLSFVGGRVGSVGIGGFALGGGTSPFSNRYGWSLDNIFEHEIVLANGTITTASESSNPDLYWALRGGANNFGIVTTFTIKVFPQAICTKQQSPTMTRNARKFWATPELYNDQDASYDMAYSYNTTSNTFTLSRTQRYARPVANASVYSEIDRVPAVARNARTGPMSMLARSPPLGVTRKLFGTTTVAPSRELLSKALAIFREEAAIVRDVQGVTPVFITYPIHKTALKAMS
ncbi:Putative FAD-binding domain, PCMH-type, FAD-binding, type PCMH, subdomain 2 [Septoria linicola]|uniref:FAD-binding domain, PCMH-type, FAD-binding, type PCMH, subdomain 2 n=1 Tax=Septoria linicola TaxID=215465 RepID=A0A9Q9AZ72_9PEZI|nr:putative FAD-binding domain, PCMH-type, FAD-binding, type PCMH, subdomain 2 [Septoria linicola]USW54733.1 Putative FAD-binding domain, PCMH-type, FAD-binding, type PCMH, subdomain 2 [Septoria linicola]